MVLSVILAVQLDPLLLSIIRRSLDWPSLAEASRRIEALAKGPGILTVLALIALLDRRRRERVLRLALVLAIVGLSVQAAKAAIGRARPTTAHHQTLIRGPAAGLSGEDYQSFPSGHSAAAFSLASAVCCWYPPLRVPALTLAGAVGLSRSYRLVHFPSDVYAGALWGFFFTRFLLRSGRLKRFSEACLRRLRLAGP